MKRLKIVAAKLFKTNSARKYFKNKLCCWKLFLKNNFVAGKYFKQYTI